MSGEGGTPSLIDLNKMLGCKLGELCLCLDVCARGGGRGREGKQGMDGGSHAHFTVQLLWHPPPTTTTHSYRHRYRCRYRYRICSATLRLPRRHNGRRRRNDYDKATRLVATFCLPSFVLLLLLLSVLLPLLLLTNRDNNTHSLIHRFSHSRASLTSIQSCAFYIIMTKSSTSPNFCTFPCPSTTLLIPLSPQPLPLSSILQLQLLLLPPLLLFTRLP